MASFDVNLYLYDISQGLAKKLLPILSGKHFDGLWHTGVVVYGREYFFGSHGIQFVTPGTTVLGHTYSVIPMGSTEVPQDIFESHLKEMAKTTFRPECYHLLDHNCNNFSDEVCLFLVSKNIPSHIISLPKEILDTPIGNFLKPLIDEIYRPNYNIITTLTGPSGTKFPRNDSETSDNDHNNSSSGSQLALLLTEFLQNPENKIDEFEQAKKSRENKQEKIEFTISPCCHNVDDVVSLLNKLETLGGLDANLNIEVQQYFDELNTSKIFQQIAHLAKLIKERNNPRSLIACQLLQALMENCSIAECVLQDSDHTFFELLEDFTGSNTAPEVIEILIKCVCNLLYALNKKGGAFLFSQSTNSDVFNDFLVFCILYDKDSINNIACQSISNAFLGQCEESLMDHYQDTCFKLGISLFEMLKKGSSLDCIHSWFSLYKCLKISHELHQFAHAMNFDEEILENCKSQSLDEDVTKLKILIKCCLA